MGKSLRHNIVWKLAGDLTVTESGTPRAEMDFVGAYRIKHRVALSTVCHPFVFTPSEVILRDL